MTRKDQKKTPTSLPAAHLGMMTYSTLPGKAICRIVWNMDGEKNPRYLEKALSGVPEDFSGRLPEVPVGTGVLTMPVYRDLPDADITCLDYSEILRLLLPSGRSKTHRLVYQASVPAEGLLHTPL